MNRAAISHHRGTDVTRSGTGTTASPGRPKAIRRTAGLRRERLRQAIGCGRAVRPTTDRRPTSNRRGPHGEVAPSPRAQATARGVAPVLRVVERLGLWVRLLPVLGRFVPGPIDSDEYLPGEHDVVVATDEKSGTNWMLQIVHQVATLRHGRLDHVHDVAPWPDAAGGQTSVAVSLGAPLTDAARYVVVIRDPEDVVVSSYHFVRGIVLGPLMPSVDTWVELFLSEQGFAPSGGPRPGHVGGWAERHRPNVLALRTLRHRRCPDDALPRRCPPRSFP